MRSFGLYILLVACALGCGKKTPTTAQDTPKPTVVPTSDKDRFQGVWKLTTVDHGDGPKPRPERAAVAVFKGDRLTYHEAANEPGDALIVAWDEAKSPKVLTLKPLTPDGKPMPVPDEVWIYRFDGDVLEVALTAGVGAAPTEFKAKPPVAQPPAPGVRVMRFAKVNEPPPNPRPSPPTRR